MHCNLIPVIGFCCLDLVRLHHDCFSFGRMNYSNNNLSFILIFASIFRLFPIDDIQSIYSIHPSIYRNSDTKTRT